MGPLSLEYHDVIDGEVVDESGYPGAGPGSYKRERSEFERHLALEVGVVAPEVNAVGELAQVSARAGALGIARAEARDDPDDQRCLEALAETDDERGDHGAVLRPARR